MNDLHKQITDALAGLAQRHNVGSAQPAPVSRREYVPAPVVRRAAVIDSRDSIAQLRADVPSTERHKYEGRYAEVAFSDGIVTVLIHTVERRANGILKAYIMRLDKRSREYVTLDRLQSLRDSE